jgi:anti-anti-sigma factor
MQRPDAPFTAALRLDQRTLVLSGELDMASTENLAEVVGPLVEEPGDVTIELHELSFIDSSGLLAMLRLADRVREGQLILRNPSEAVRRVLEMVELADVSPHIVIED